MTDVLHIDVETVAVADLKRTGAWRYAEHPDTDCIVACYRFGANGPVKTWLPGSPCPVEIQMHVEDGGRIAAWNAMFERAIWLHVLTPKHGWPLPLAEQFECSMAQAAYWGLPLSLDMAADAVGAPPKDKEGHRLMLRMSRPRKENPDGTYEWWHLDDPARYLQLQLYCADDVRAETGIVYKLPELPPYERKVWHVDQAINARGVRFDVELVIKLHSYAGRAKKTLDAEVKMLTGGFVSTCNQVAATLTWLGNLGVHRAALDKASVAAALDNPKITGAARRVLECRQQAAKSSTSKLNAMLSAVGSEDRIRGMLQYYGAFRTGRYAGRLVQPQNMPRGEIKDPDRAIDWMLRDIDDEMLEMAFGPVLSIVSSCLRGCIVPGEGKIFLVLDFSQIEARVLAWLAGQQDILDVFASGEDVYTYDAKKIGSDNRNLGKACRLGLGFGMGGPKFVDAAAIYGVDLPLALAKKVVDDWRTANQRIVDYWYLCQDSAIRAVREKRVFSVLNIKYGMMGPHLLCLLPSGRRLVYRDAKLETDEYGRDRLTYMGMNQYTRKWERLDTWGGKLVENITQAVARDLMIDAMLRVDRETGNEIVLTVHDELIMETASETPKAELKRVQDIMRTNPAWAEGLPTDCDGWTGKRYKK